MLAHHVHNLNTERASMARRATCVMTMLALTLLAGCLIAPPIEAEPPEINQSPFIDSDRVIPADPFIIVTDSTPIAVEASQLFDPNVETALFYAFIGQRGGQLKNSQAQIIPDQDELYRGIYLRYEGADYSFNPCAVATRDAESETIFLYVSDRPFLEITPEGATPADDAFMVSYSWVFEIAEGACAQ